jgi:DNA (cytosine-5)-methyltransferase 1
VIFASVCSGIEAPSVAWSPLGWRAAFFSEIERFPNAVLAHHYPDVPNLGDMNAFQTWPDARIDLLVGGTPCQSFSVAGLRGGLADPRGNLALVFLGVVDRYRPRWICWENVPGVLSSDGGRAFGAFLGGLGQLGYGWSYRVLDAQYFGVPQRRRRVFVVGHLGDWRRAAAVLFEPSCLRRDSPPSRETREGIAPSLAARTRGGGGLGTDAELDGGLVAAFIETGLHEYRESEAAGTLKKSGGVLAGGSETFIAHSLRADGFDASEDGTGRGTPLVFDERQVTSPDPRGDITPGRESHTLHEHPPTVAFSCKDSGADADELAPTLRAMGHDSSHANAGGQVAVAFNWQSGGDARGLDPKEVTSALSREQTPAMLSRQVVRRLTPTECARLQGFPDDYLDILYRGKPAADGPKYKALGNSMCVNIIAWLGHRIETVDAIP